MAHRLRCAPVRRVLLATLLLVLACPAAASAATQGKVVVEPSPAPGVERLHYEFGPVHVAPGQNDIRFAGNELKPPQAGWIVRFKPGLVYAKGGGTPRVDVVHLHHAVWLANGRPLFAAGEEKTTVQSPPGYGWHFQPSDSWVMNHMIHNLTPTPTDVYITYDLDFIPEGSPAAAGMHDVQTVWMDVMGLSVYPVFNVLRGSGRNGRYTYPNDAPGARTYTRNRWTVDQDGVLVGAVGHLHPGGLWTTLSLTRNGRTVRLFRSRAHYYEPAGAVSWDVAMTVTPSGWRVGVRRGDVLSVSATYDSRRASWYESMGIMPVEFSPGGTGPDPFTTKVDVPGHVTHGHLHENRNHGGRFAGLPDPRKMLSAVPPSAGVTIKGFTYRNGDLSYIGLRGRPPAVRAGRSLRFVNGDAGAGILHTITACRAPCNRTTGIAYPLANGRVNFDSGDLGYGPAGFTAAANRDTWRTPKWLKPGTYTYFCRIHPFMRGSFRVKPAKH
jgi:plastocyanin